MSRMQINKALDELADTIDEHVTSRQMATLEKLDQMVAELNVLKAEVASSYAELRSGLLQEIAGREPEEVDDGT